MVVDTKELAYERALVTVWQSLGQLAPIDFKPGPANERAEEAYYAAENALFNAGRIVLVDGVLVLRDAGEVSDAR